MHASDFSIVCSSNLAASAGAQSRMSAASKTTAKTTTKTI